MFELDGDWLPVTIEVLDTNGWFTSQNVHTYNIRDIPVMFYEAENALSYNDNTFLLYDGWVYVNSVGDTYAVRYDDGTRRAIDGDTILAAAHGRLYVRDGNDLKVYLIDAPHDAPMAVVEDVLPEGMLAWVDSYTPAVYVIDTEALTASKVHWE